MSGTQVQCEETGCLYHTAGRCIAEHVTLVIEQGDLICDTYENRDLFGEFLDGFNDEQWADDWHVGREDGR
jgi:hypothetical protein